MVFLQCANIIPFPYLHTDQRGEKPKQIAPSTLCRNVLKTKHNLFVLLSGPQKPDRSVGEAASLSVKCLASDDVYAAIFLYFQIVLLKLSVQ